ncbi:MAG TPA: hypothetical protein VMY59_01085 [Candidatus Thermoplasmatota archaeon]|nr:hypothetical protein [Candidatus Thermoplasmatota archaeon]
MIEKKQQKRATYEDTLNQQEELRKKLDILIQENRCVKDDKEREKLFHLFGDCFLGEDGEKKIHYFMRYPPGIIIEVDDFGEMIRLLCYECETMIPISFFGYHSNQSVPIRDVWRAIRNIAFGLFPVAQNKAVSISKEQTHIGPSDAGRV